MRCRLFSFLKLWFFKNTYIHCVSVPCVNYFWCSSCPTFDRWEFLSFGLSVLLIDLSGHLVHILLRTWSQSFPQGALVSVSGEWASLGAGCAQCCRVGVASRALQRREKQVLWEGKIGLQISNLKWWIFFPHWILQLYFFLLLKISVPKTLTYLYRLTICIKIFSK